MGATDTGGGGAGLDGSLAKEMFLSTILQGNRVLPKSPGRKKQRVLSHSPLGHTETTRRSLRPHCPYGAAQLSERGKHPISPGWVLGAESGPVALSPALDLREPWWEMTAKAIKTFLEET